MANGRATGFADVLRPALRVCWRLVPRNVVERADWRDRGTTRDALVRNMLADF